MSSLTPLSGTQSPIDDRKVLDALVAAVIVTDRSGRILRWNSTTTEMFGWLGEEGPRRAVQFLLASGTAASSGPEGPHHRVSLRRHDGSVGHYAVERATLEGSADRLTVWTITENEAEEHAPVLVLPPGVVGPPASTSATDPRNELLADLDGVLSRCRTGSEVLEAVPGSLVPPIADWCGLFLVPESRTEGREGALDCNAVASNDSLGTAVWSAYTSSSFTSTASAAIGTVLAAGHRKRLDHLDRRSIVTLGFCDDASTGLLDHGIHASLMLPLLSGAQPVGVLHLLRGPDHEPFTDDEVHWLSQMTARIAATCAPLLEAERNQELAMVFQESLLPDELPAIPGMEVAARFRAGNAGADVGGDVYDVVAAGPDHWSVLVADICGRGPTAAARAGVVRHSFRMSAWHGDTPAQILEWLNRALRSADDDVFCTAAAASIDRVDGDVIELTCALGGHPQPLLCRADGTVEAFGEYGMLLGTDLSVRHVATTTRLERGDAVVFYTDGLTDVAPPHHLTDDELAALVATAWSKSSSATDLADHLLIEADRVRSLDQRSDDIALLVLRHR
jgi:hypothetical protein